MLSGEGEIELANPPPDPEPNTPAPIHLPKPNKEAKQEPEEEQDEGDLEKDGLGLGELLDGVQGEDGVEEGGGIGSHPGAHLPVVQASVRQHAAAAAADAVVARVAGAEGAVVSEGIRWAR